MLTELSGKSPRFGVESIFAGGGTNNFYPHGRAAFYWTPMRVVSHRLKRVNTVRQRTIKQVKA